MTESTDWRPRVVALDIDGTLLSWVEGAGTTYGTVTPAVHDAVQAVLDAGLALRGLEEWPGRDERIPGHLVLAAEKA